MKDTLECIICQDENAFHNGVNYECPNCGSAWDEDEIFLNGLEADLENEEDDEFKRLSKLEKPLFILKQGKIYECTVGFESRGEFTEEEIKIVPLAYKDNKNLLFITMYDDKSFTDYPNAITDLSKMDFIDLWNDGFENYFDSISMIPNMVVATTEDNSLIDHKGDLFSGFKELD
jgi:hypothetical protein